MSKKTTKDLKPGDNLYFLDIDHHSAYVYKIISIEKDEDYDSLKITWEKGDDYYSSIFPNYAYASEDSTMFFEEPDYDSEDYNEDEDEEEDGRNIYVNKEDVISRLNSEIDRLKKEIESLS